LIPWSAAQARSLGTIHLTQYTQADEGTGCREVVIRQPRQSQGQVGPQRHPGQGSASALPAALQTSIRSSRSSPSDYLVTCERTAATEGSSRGPDELYSMKSWPVTSNAAAKKTAKASWNKSSISSQRLYQAPIAQTRLETGVVPRKDTFRDARDRHAAVPMMRSEQTLART
jgi:hypothetical protein